MQCALHGVSEGMDKSSKEWSFSGKILNYGFSVLHTQQIPRKIPVHLVTSNIVLANVYFYFKEVSPWSQAHVSGILYGRLRFKLMQANYLFQLELHSGSWR